MVYLQLKNEMVASGPQNNISFMRNANAEKTPENPAPSTTKMETEAEETKSNKILFKKDEKFQKFGCREQGTGQSMYLYLFIKNTFY